MTGAQLAALRQSTGLSGPELAAVLGVDRSTVYRWESGASPIPAAVPLALLTIRRHRTNMAGNNYPLAADVQRVMLDEGVDRDTAVRSFGVEP